MTRTIRYSALAVALVGSGVALADPIKDLPHTIERCYTKIVHPKQVIYRKRVVHAKPKPPVEVIRYVSSPCVPMGIQTPPVNTAFTIEDQDIPWLAGATRNPPSHYRIDYGYPVNGGRIIPLPPTPPSSVPEPASWAMMVAGFGVMGCVMRRRKGAWA